MTSGIAWGIEAEEALDDLEASRLLGDARIHAYHYTLRGSQKEALADESRLIGGLLLFLPDHIGMDNLSRSDEQ